MTTTRPAHEVEPEFSRVVDAERLGVGEEVREIEASEDERAALAERFGLRALNDLRATLRLKRAAGGAVRVTGTLRADVVQTCVVSLEPVAAHIEETMRILYVPAERLAHEREVVIRPDEEEILEPLEDSTMDLGEAVAQQLAVALDPYPRAPGARFEGHYGPEEGAEPEDEGGGRFARLAVLKKRGS